jgi:hypothetical protein
MTNNRRECGKSIAGVEGLAELFPPGWASVQACTAGSEAGSDGGTRRLPAAPAIPGRLWGVLSMPTRRGDFVP